VAFFKVFVMVGSVYLFGRSLYSTIFSIFSGKSFVTPLIVALISAAVFFLFIGWEILKKDKQKEKPVESAIGKELFKDEFNKAINKFKKTNNILLICLGIVVLCYFAIFMLFLTTSIDWVLPAFLIAMIVGIVCFCIAVNNSLKRENIVKCSKSLKKQGVSLDYCLEGMENAPILPENRVICADNAFIIEKSHIVIPYSSVLWIHKRVSSVNGIATFSGWVLYTTTGENIGLTASDEEAQIIIQNYYTKFPKEFVAGFGKEQKKAYNIAKKHYRELYKNMNSKK
jgi:hypothetical protein